MSLVARELRLGRRERLRLARKIACARLAGVVTAVRKQDGRWQVRLEIGDDPTTGTKVLSPWVRITTVAAGDVKVAIKPSVGQRMHLVSASGVVGGDSVAEWGSYDDEKNQPDGDEDVVIERGQARIEMTAQAVRSKVGGAEIEIKSGAINIVANTIHLVGLTSVGVDAKDEVAAPKIITEAGPAAKARAKAG